MRDEDKTKEQLINELVEMRQRIAELETSETEHRQAEEEIKQRNRELAALNAIATVVSQSLSLDEILNAALDRVLELMRLDVGGMYLADPARRKLDLVVHRGVSEEFANEIGSVSVGEKTLEAVTAEGKLRRFILLVEAVVKDQAELKRIVSAMKKEGLSLDSGVPVLLQAKEEILGLMIVANRVPRQFSEAELQLLTSIGQQIAIAIENARLFEGARRRLHELESLAQTSAAITSTLELHPLLENILNAAMAVVPVTEKGSILLLDETTGELAIQILVGYSDPRIRSARFPREAGYSAKAVREGCPLLIPDARTDPSIRYDGEIEEMRAILSAAVVPLQVKGGIIGVIALDNASRKAAFNEDDLRLLTTFADQAAIAIENARLYQEARARAEAIEQFHQRLWALQETSRVMSSTLVLKEVLRTVQENIALILPGAEPLFVLVDEERQVIRPILVFPENPVLRQVRKVIGKRLEELALPLAELTDRQREDFLAGKVRVAHKLPEALGRLLSEPVLAAAQKALGIRALVSAPLLSRGNFLGLILVFVRQEVEPPDLELLKSLAQQAAIAIENARLYEATQQELAERKQAEEELQQSFKQLRRALEGTVKTLVSAIEMRDPYTAGHQRRVTQLACAIAKEMDFSEEQIEGIRMAGLIHDLGKINVPAEILSKPGPLTELEYGLIKMHPQIGHDVLNEAIEFPWPLAQIVLQHHERMDGSGYPQGLLGEEIILEARILAVADVVEAMASHRPYRSARGIDEALEEISQNRGVLYDPEVVDACLKLFAERGFELE